MNIPKAIETLTRLRDAADPDECQPEKEAIKLGIEALKGYQVGRTLPGGQFFHDLPSETEE